MVLSVRRADGAALTSLRADPSRVASFMEGAGAGESDVLELDKSWHALHFLLTGDAGGAPYPLGLVMGGEDIGADQGYGPARLIEPAEMLDFSAALSELSDADLKRRYDPAEMAQHHVYIADSLVEEGEEGWDYLASFLSGLRRFAERCVHTNSGAIILIG